MKRRRAKLWAPGLLLSCGAVMTSCGSDDTLLLPPMGSSATAGDGFGGDDGGGRRAWLPKLDGRHDRGVHGHGYGGVASSSGAAGTPVNGGGHHGGLTGALGGATAAAGEGESGGAAGTAGIPEGGATTGEGGATSGEGGAGGSAPFVALGTRCETTLDCGSDGLICVPSSHEVAPEIGSISNGLCTRRCEEDAECRDLDPDAFCLWYTEESGGHCVQSCELGGRPGDSKCHGRSDMACQALPNSETENCSVDAQCTPDEQCIENRCSVVGCVPQCTNDEQCPAGRFCDQWWGLCASTPQPNPEFGEYCPIDNKEETLCGGRGVCLGVMADGVRVTSFCTQRCVLGYGCANGEGACLLEDHGFHADVGDTAYCAPACNCNDDCKAMGLDCVPVDDATPTHRGLCLHPFDDDNQPLETLPCSTGGPSSTVPAP